ncbi:MAG: hypothetical protein A3F74_00155 [Betaproteobacteria bacterium RIFCSPLOWO2_12_FULL_62_58]|nr:MAG: hypothetical protein A3F74_00155 [Betaproteobacteria bacterium RIFCSPLOWO2_12_FULL_62_58]HLB30059.1 hypothetical protein [Gammaproteobacteria bacterium]
MTTPWLTRLKGSLAWATFAFLLLAIALLVDTFLSKGDMGIIVMATAVTISTMVTLALSYESLQTSRQGILEARKEQLHLLHNYLKCVSLLTQTFKTNIEVSRQSEVSRIHLQELLQSLSAIYDALLAKEQLGLIAGELVRLIENRVRIKELSDALTSAEVPNFEEMLRIVERVSRANRQAEEKLERMLGAESLEQFEKFANPAGD